MAAPFLLVVIGTALAFLPGVSEGHPAAWLTPPISAILLLEGTLALGPWTGVAIGGLSVGEAKPVMHRVLESLAGALPREYPRYLMGVGFPEDLIEGIEQTYPAADPAGAEPTALLLCARGPLALEPETESRARDERMAGAP